MRTFCGTKFLVDDSDYERLLEITKFYVNPFGYIVFRPRGSSQVASKTRLHRFLLSPSTDQHVDHINGDLLDNRRLNLRVCSRSENMRNTKPKKSRQHGLPFKGIEKRHNKWGAVLLVNGERYRLSGFLSAKDAAHAYDDLARTYHVDFARLNFPRVAA